MADLTKLQRELISRGTLVVLALVVLYGSYRCFAAGHAWQKEFDEKHPEYVGRREQGTSGALIPYAAGLVLLAGGAFLGFMGLASSWRLQRCAKWCSSIRAHHVVIPRGAVATRGISEWQRVATPRSLVGKPPRDDIWAGAEQRR